MGSLLVGAMLALLSTQDGPAARESRLPFETGQISLVTAVRDHRACAATGRGRGFEAFVASFCGSGATQPPPGSRRTLLIGFTRAGERQEAPVAAPGRRVYDLEADVELDASGGFSACRVVREQGASHLFFYRDRPCNSLRRERPLFAAATGSGLRHGRLRISIFIDAPPAVIANLLRPQPPLPQIVATPPPVMMAPAPPAPPPPMRPAPSSPARPINRDGWFSSDDYPAAALRAEEQGTVTARLDVSPAGRVSACTVIQSSGSAALDAAACRIFRSRARYQPARDAQGQAIAGALLERVRWVLPEYDLLGRAPAYAALSIGIDGDTRTYCDTIDEVPAYSGLASVACRFIVPPDGAVPPAIEQGRAAVRITVEIARESMPRPEFTRQPGPTIFAAAAVFEVQPDGGIGTCRTNVIVAPRAGGVPPFDLCAALQGASSPLFVTRQGAAPEPTRLILTVLEGGRR